MSDGLSGASGWEGSPDAIDKADELLQFRSEEDRWTLLRERAEAYRRLQEELDQEAYLLMALIYRLVGIGDGRSTMFNQLIGSGNVPVEKWIADRRMELASGLQPGALLAPRRKPPRQRQEPWQK